MQSTPVHMKYACQYLFCGFPLHVRLIPFFVLSPTGIFLVPRVTFTPVLGRLLLEIAQTAYTKSSVALNVTPLTPIQAGTGAVTIITGYCHNLFTRLSQGGSLLFHFINYYQWCIIHEVE